MCLKVPDRPNIAVRYKAIFFAHFSGGANSSCYEGLGMFQNRSFLIDRTHSVGSVKSVGAIYRVSSLSHTIHGNKSAEQHSSLQSIAEVTLHAW
jgi:hypothetical protein